MHLNIILRRLSDQQINYQMTKKLSDMICLPINYYLVKKKSINFIFYIYFIYRTLLSKEINTFKK